MTPIKTILHPTDFSEGSGLALDMACALARDQEARLLILHVVPTPFTALGGADVSTFRQAESVQQDLQSYETEMEEKLRHLSLDPHIRVERLVREGEVVTETIRTAQENLCDLIVLGSHGRSEEVRSLLGSVTEAVSRKASCPVLIVKTPPVEMATQGAEPMQRAEVL